MLDELTKTLSPRLMFLLLMALATLIASTGYSVWFKKPLKEYRQSLSQLENLQHQPVNQQTVETNIRQLRQNITDLNQQLTKRGREVLKGTKAISVISDLGSYAKMHNVQLLGVSPAAPVTGKHYTEVPFHVEIAGKYTQLFKWVYTLEHANSPLFIKEFTLQPGASADSRIMKLTIDLIQPLMKG